VRFGCRFERAPRVDIGCRRTDVIPLVEARKPAPPGDRDSIIVCRERRGGFIPELKSSVRDAGAEPVRFESGVGRGNSNASFSRACCTTLRYPFWGLSVAKICSPETANDSRNSGDAQRHVPVLFFARPKRDIPTRRRRVTFFYPKALRDHTARSALHVEHIELLKPSRWLDAAPPLL